jgi:hypothetical protein
MALAAQFEAPLDLRRAAAEVGLPPKDFLARLAESPEIGRSIGGLRLPGGTVSRETFDRAFLDVINEWKPDSPVLTNPTPQPPGGTGVGGTGVSPVVIAEPKLPGGRAEFKLSEPFAQVRTGGAGRYLIFHLPKGRKLAIFDVSQLKVVHEIDLPADQVLYAAGLDKLLIVLPSQRLLQRWSLTTFQREKTVPIAGDEGVRGAFMGCSSHGPLLLFMGKLLRPWDVEQLEPIKGDTKGLGGDPGYDFQTRVSADGQTVTIWHGAIGPNQYALIHLGKPNRIASSPDGHSFNGRWAMPNADGTRVFRFGPGLYDGDMRILDPGQKAAVLLPTEEPRFFLAVNEESRDTNQVSICTSTDRMRVATIKGVEKVTGSGTNSGWGHFRGEPRIHYLPSANVLVNLPESNDRVVVRRLHLMELLAQSGGDYLFVLSHPADRVEAGSRFAYQMDVRSKAGGVRYRLESGPEGMTVSGAGIVRWQVPASPEKHEVRVVVTVRSASGKEVQHAFGVKVVDPAAISQ